MQLQDYINDVQEHLHDQIGVSWSQPRLISRINEARLYTAMDMKCIRRLTPNLQLVSQTEIYNLFGAIAGVTLVSGGSNYSGTSVPITATAAPPGGTNFLAIGNVQSGTVTSVTVLQWGQGYTTPPTLTVGGTGSGAVVTPQSLINLLYPISLTYLFNGVRTTLRFLPFSLFQAYARILGIQFASTPGVWTWVQESRSIFIQPPPNQNYTLEIDATFLPFPLVNLTDLDTDLVDPWDRAPQFAAASLLFMKDQDAGRARSEFHARNYAQMVPRIVTGVGGVRIPNIYNRNFQRMVSR